MAVPGRVEHRDSGALLCVCGWGRLWAGGVGRLVVQPDLPAARAAADEVQKGIVAGTVHPFTGELKDQKGTLRLKAGETASDEVLSKMDWYVDGVQA